jgi:glutamyl-Q tRNA(Asp) synthetase
VQTSATSYIGRFAPSPTGPLHAGSLVAALASWLDARAHGGQWLVRIEDVDTPRCVPGADSYLLQQLATCGLHSDAPVVYQSQRAAHYQAALDRLTQQGMAYPCACSRSDIEAAWQRLGMAKPRHGELPYLATCRHGLQGRTGRAWRFRTDIFNQNTLAAQAFNAQEATVNIALSLQDKHLQVRWSDRRLGPQQHDVGQHIGDFVLRRADGLWAYQLAVVVDDALQGITHIVRGQDLADNTARQIALQTALGTTPPQYLHTPLVLAADGQKLSKQNGAHPLELHTPASTLLALQAAALTLALPAYAGTSVPQALAHWTQAWAAMWSAKP